MAKKTKRQRTICGSELERAGSIYVCSRSKDHTGPHREGKKGPEAIEWPNENDPTTFAPSAPPVAKPDSEQVLKKPERTVEYQEGLEAIETEGSVKIQVASDKLLVDKLMFSRAVKAIIQGAQGGRAYANRAGITRFGQIMGGKNQEEFNELYRACMQAVEEDNKLQKANK